MPIKEVAERRPFPRISTLRVTIEPSGVRDLAKGPPASNTIAHDLYAAICSGDEDDFRELLSAMAREIEKGIDREFQVDERLVIYKEKMFEGLQKAMREGLTVDTESLLS